MNIFVCMKRVPDTESQIQLAADGRSVDTAGLNYIINPYDEYAIEAALKLQEAHGGSVTLLTVGEADADKTLRKALAMGGDQAVLLTVDKDLSDPRQAALALAEWLKGQSMDLILCGKQGVDHDHGSTGPMLAELLGLPCVAGISALALEGNTLTVEREIEGGKEKYRTTTPAVLSCDKGLNEPRYASLKGIMMAKKKPLETLAAQTGESLLNTEGLGYPAARPAGRIIGKGPEAVGELLGLLKNEAKIL